MSTTKKEKTTKKKDKKVDKEVKEEAAPEQAAAAPAEPEVVAAPVEPPAPQPTETAPPEETKGKKKKSSQPAETAPPEEAKEEPNEEVKEEKKKEKREEKRDAHEPKRAQRATSNVFALFNQAQIQEFKEAFTMIDQNRDGLIDVKDLHAIYAQIGREPESRIMEEMIAEAPGPLNFTMFLGLFGDRLKGTDPEPAVRDAFIMFDTEGKGKLPEDYVRDLLMNVGDTFSKEEIKLVWKEAPIEGGMLDYLKFVKLIKRGREDEF